MGIETPDPLATALSNRIQHQIARYGLIVTYTRGTGAGALSEDISARVSAMSSSLRFQWFTAGETEGWALPAYIVTVGGDFRPRGSEPAPGDTVLLPTGLYTVRKWEKSRLGKTVIRTTLFVARDI